MRVRRLRPINHEIQRFRADPGSIRNATIVIITVTVAAVFVGSLVMWLFDKRDFPDYGVALWFVLQTVTTVGYGDVTPTSGVGRAVAAVVMIVAIAFLTIVTAIITSTFIDAAQRRRNAVETDARQDRSDHVDARFDEILERLTAIEAAIAGPTDLARQAADATTPPPGDPPSTTGTVPGA